MRKSVLSILCTCLFLVIGLAILPSCNKEGEEKENRAPNTEFSIEEINLFGEDRLNSIVSLSWLGTDPDGYVVGYELSLDKQNWNFTTRQDSIFKFSIDPGSDTTDITLFVRAIDNEGLIDPSPDKIRIPLKNTPPEVDFDEKFILPDTANIVITLAWAATDFDGDETIISTQISLDGKRWVEISNNATTFSLAPNDPLAQDSTEALIYYGTSKQPQKEMLNKLSLNDTNRVFIRVIDQANTESKIDTSTTFFLIGKTHDLLVVGGLEAADATYRSTLQAKNIDYDFLNFTAGNGIRQPNIWNITFSLQLSFYDKLFLYSDESLFTNSFTGVKNMILEFAASALQEYANAGGKYMISTSLLHSTNIDGFAGVLPIRSLSQSNFGSARFYEDSLAVGVLDSLPDLKPGKFLILGPTVFDIDSADTEVIYEANLSDNTRDRGPWNDTKIFGSARRQNGKLNQVFFSLQLWELNGDQAALETLFDQILNVEFN